MKLFISFIVCYTLFVSHVRANCRGKRDVDDLGLCGVVSDDGSITPTPYSRCESICCGGALSPMGVGLRCCGTADLGHISNATQLCCSYGNEYRVYDKVTENDFCCGLDRFDQSKYANGLNCCNNPRNVPQIFNTRTEMCCEGNVSFVGDTAFGSCCQDQGYDRRQASCPCLVGPVIFGAGDDAGCCRSRSGRRMENYNRKTEGCCNGAAYSLDHEFCCGNQVGVILTQFCCGNRLHNKAPGDDAGILSCCELSDGTRVGYNPVGHICCGHTVQELLIDDDAICCGDHVYYVKDSGDSCCHGADGSYTPYDSRTQVCCGGNVGHGDGCCNDTPYFPGEQLCCHGTVGGHDYKWPSCCGTTPFDAYIQTCCGTTVFSNPTIPGPVEGMNQTSHFTRCCGNYADDSELAPYDYLHGICCGGSVYDVDADSFGSAECCGRGKIDSESEICCDYESLPRVYGADTGCCGEAVFDQSAAICCNGNIQSLDGVARENAVCCGDSCMDASAYYCCEGRRYSKDAITVEDFNTLSCDFDGEPAMGPRLASAPMSPAKSEPKSPAKSEPMSPAKSEPMSPVSSDAMSTGSSDAMSTGSSESMSTGGSESMSTGGSESMGTGSSAPMSMGH